MTRLPISIASTILEDRRREWETLRRQRIVRESLAEQRRLQKVAKARARDGKHPLTREPAEIDVLIDLTGSPATSEPKEYVHS